MAVGGRRGGEEVETGAEYASKGMNRVCYGSVERNGSCMARGKGDEGRRGDATGRV